MGQAKLRGSFEDRKKESIFYKSENKRYQNWLKGHRPKETRSQREAIITFNVLRAMTYGSGFYF